MRAPSPFDRWALADDLLPPRLSARVRSAEGIPFLGSIPLDPRIGKSCDHGVSFLEEYPESPSTKAYLDIVASCAPVFLGTDLAVVSR